MTDVRQGVLNLHPLSELGPTPGVRWRSLSSSSSRSSGWMLTLLPPFLLFVQRSRKGHAAQVAAGKRTTPPTLKGIETPARQRKSSRSQSSSKAVLG